MYINVYYIYMYISYVLVVLQYVLFIRFFLICFFQNTRSYLLYIYMSYAYVSKLVEAGRTHGPFFFFYGPVF